MTTAPQRARETIVVVTGGDPVDPGDLAGLLRAGDPFVIAADSGIDRAAQLGLRVDLAVGDFDSVTTAALDAVTAAGAIVERHPEAKDATDLELALDAALARQPARVVVVGGHGGRLDHFLANTMLLAAHTYEGVEVVAQMGPARVTVVHREAELHGRAGDLVTLVPAHGAAGGVSTEGLLYPLRDDDLAPGSTRGVSNELTGPTASVSLRAGVLLVVQPGRRGTHQRGGTT
jgi:thiamine pyrophosphokinase